MIQKRPLPKIRVEGSGGLADNSYHGEKPRAPRTIVVLAYSASAGDLGSNSRSCRLDCEFAMNYNQMSKFEQREYDKRWPWPTKGELLVALFIGYIIGLIFG